MKNAHNNQRMMSEIWAPSRQRIHVTFVKTDFFQILIVEIKEKRYKSAFHSGMNQISPLNTENPDGWCYIEDKNIIKMLKNQIIWHFLSNSGSSEPNPAFSNTKP